MDTGIISGNGVSSAFPDTSCGSWFVLRTKSRHEKILAADLTAAGVGCFLPLVSCVRHYAGRKVMVELPLFPGYLFLRGSADDTYSADRTRRVAQIIPVYDQQRMDEELRNLHLAISVNATLDPFPYLKRGVRVEVRSGPMRGLRGWVVDRIRFDRLILQVQMLGQATSLEIDGSLLDVIGEDLPRGGSFRLSRIGA